MTQLVNHLACPSRGQKLGQVGHCSILSKASRAFKAGYLAVELLREFVSGITFARLGNIKSVSVIRGQIQASSNLERQIRVGDKMASEGNHYILITEFFV